MKRNYAQTKVTAQSRMHRDEREHHEVVSISVVIGPLLSALCSDWFSFVIGVMVAQLFSTLCRVTLARTVTQII
jgi:hypothetical protein